MAVTGLPAAADASGVASRRASAARACCSLLAGRHAAQAGGSRRSDPPQLPDACGCRTSAGPTSRRRRRCSAHLLKRLGYKPDDHRAVGAGDLRLAEEQGPRRLPRQLDARPGGRTARPTSRTARSRSGAPTCVGAKYTLAVPAYAYEAGLKSFADIERFAPQLNASIYGIEPGNDGNRLVLSMIKQNLFGLGGFKLVESSEQGMLAEVERAIHARQPIVFLAWDPHPMNMRFDLKLPLRRRCGVRPQLRRGASSTPTPAPATPKSAPTSGRLLREPAPSPRSRKVA